MSLAHDIHQNNNFLFQILTWWCVVSNVLLTYSTGAMTIKNNVFKEKMSKKVLLTKKLNGVNYSYHQKFYKS